MKKYLLIAAKLLIAATVLGWVFHKLGATGRQQLWESARSAHPLFLALGFLMFFIVIGIGICRWQILLRMQGIRISYYRAIWITAVGTFFNAFLIGATGGDVLKAWYAAEAAPDHRPKAVLSVIVDRLIGLTGLFVLALFVILLYLPVLLANPKTKPLAYMVFLIVAGLVVVAALITQRRRLATHPLWLKIWHYLPAKNILSKLSESVDLYEAHPQTLLITLALSVGVHTFVVMSAWFVGQALDVRGVSLIQYFIYCPLINTFAAIPATPGGLGLREGAFKFFFSDLLGVPLPQTVALSLLFYSGNIFASLTCGILYVLGKPKDEISPSQIPTE